MYVNNVLRGINPNLKLEDLSDLERDAIKQLDRLTNRDTVGETTLYRTVDASALFGNISDLEYESLRNVLVYKDDQKYTKAQTDKAMAKLVSSYTEKGYMSTTKDASIASDSAYMFGSEKPIILEVKTSKTTKGIDVNKYANNRMKEVEKADPQKEVLLARNQNFKTNKKLSATKDGFIKVTIYQK